MNIDLGRVRSVLSAAEGALLEVDVYDILEACDLRAPKRVLLAPGTLEAVDAALVLPGEQIYLKLQATGLLHKTEAGAVRKVAKTADAIGAAARDMIAAAGVDDSQLRGVLAVEAIEVEKTAAPLELLLGARRLRDFGPIVVLGIGGIGAEFWNPKLRDEHALRMISAADLDNRRARTFVHTLPMRELWSGFRGGPVLLDDAELQDWVQALAALVEYFDGSEPDRSPAIVEAEINPLVVSGGTLLPLDGLIRVEHDISLGQGDAAPTDRLQTLLHPKTAAIAGVSSKGPNPGRIIMRNLLAGGFTPDRLAILKPGGGEVDGVACYDNVESVPFDIDLLVLAVDANATLQVLEHAGGKVKSALLIAGGTSERSEGKELGERLAQAIDKSGIAAVGPNCLGVISRPAGLDTLFIPHSKIPRCEREPGNLAYISQSGAFMITRMNRQSRYEPRYAISTGNQLRTGVSDALAAVAADEAVNTFAVYVEGFGAGDGLRFCQLARKLNRQGRRVILYKGGRTAAGADAASGHTASLATDYNVCRQLAEEAGVLVAETFEAFEDLVLLASAWAGKSLGEHRMALVSNAGYECVGMADQLGSLLTRAQFDEATIEGIREAQAKCGIDRLVDISNPIDLTPMANADVWCGVAEAMLGADNVDLAVISPVPPTPALQTLAAADSHREDVSRDDGVAARLGAVIASSDKPVACCVDCGTLYDAFSEELARRAGLRVPVFRSADRMVKAISAYANVAQRR
ncbi:MAG: acetate--CoA ligase family protein [Phycisphaerales bacterium JB038]